MFNTNEFYQFAEGTLRAALKTYFDTCEEIGRFNCLKGVKPIEPPCVKGTLIGVFGYCLNEFIDPMLMDSMTPLNQLERNTIVEKSLEVCGAVQSVNNIPAGTEFPVDRFLGNVCFQSLERFLTEALSQKPISPEEVFSIWLDNANEREGDFIELVQEMKFDAMKGDFTEESLLLADVKVSQLYDALKNIKEYELAFSLRRLCKVVGKDRVRCQSIENKVYLVEEEDMQVSISNEALVFNIKRELLDVLASYAAGQVKSILTKQKKAA